MFVGFQYKTWWNDSTVFVSVVFEHFQHILIILRYCNRVIYRFSSLGGTQGSCSRKNLRCSIFCYCIFPPSYANVYTRITSGEGTLIRYILWLDNVIYFSTLKKARVHVCGFGLTKCECFVIFSYSKFFLERLCFLCLGQWFGSVLAQPWQSP